MPTTLVSAGLDSNDLVMTYAKEATWGTKPTVPFQTLRLDGEGFSSSKSRTRPSEINSTGQASAAITTKVESTGSLNASISSGTFNDFLSASIGGVWSHGSYVPASATIAMTATTITDSASVFITGPLGVTATSVGYLIKMYCTGTGAATWNGTVFLVTGTAAGVLTCSYVSGGTGSPTMSVLATSVFGTCKFEFIGMKSGSATIAATGTGFTDTASNFVNNGFVAGQMIRVSGATAASINTYYRIVTVAAGTITTLPAPATTEAANANIKIQGSYCRNGLTFESFYVQKYLAASKYLVYAGAFPTGGSLDVGVGDYLKGTFSFLNQAEAKQTTDGSTGTAIGPTTGVVIDSIAGIGTPKRGNPLGTTLTDVAAKVQKLGIKFNKEGAATQMAIGSAAAVGLRKGTFTVTGNLTTYFADFTLYDEFVNETNGSIGFPAVDGSGNGYYITICNGTIQNPKVVCGGPGQDVMADFEIEGNPDTTGIFGYKTLQIDYFGG